MPVFAGRTLAVHIRRMAPIKVLGFAGSLRQGSYNRALIGAAQKLAPEAMRFDVIEFDAAGQLTDDATARYLTAYLVAFQAWVLRFK
jgi:chromate reductase